MHRPNFAFTDTSAAPDRKSALRMIFVRWLGTATALLVLVLVVSLFALLTHHLDATPRTPNPAGSGTWKTYRDPRGLFSLQLPERWIASVDTSTTSMSDTTGSATRITTEDVAFIDPALGDASARVYVSATPIQSDFDRNWYCQTLSQKYNVLLDVTPESLSLAHFSFETASVAFGVSVTIPGVLGPPQRPRGLNNPLPTPTPLPQQVVAADRTLLVTILNSFRPADPTPLSC